MTGVQTCALPICAEGYVETDLSLLEDAELLIMLAKPMHDEKVIKNFDGTIIDITGYEFSPDAEVFKVYEPVRKILRNIAVPVSAAPQTYRMPGRYTRPYQDLSDPQRYPLCRENNHPGYHMALLKRL